MRKTFTNSLIFSGDVTNEIHHVYISKTHEFDRHGHV